MIDDAQEVDVSLTAKAMAAVRACESKREDALFVDPFAEKLAGQEAMLNAVALVAQYENEGRPYAQVRTRFLDDFLLENLTKIHQVVLLGAGLDTRAFRLDLPADLHWYEVDQQDVILYKNRILANDTPSCVRRCVAANLAESEWVDLLLAEGFDPEQPTMWILEGFIYYLMEDHAKILMHRIDDLSAVGSCLGCDLINNTVCNGSEQWASLWQFGCDVPEAFFAAYGWQAQAVQPNEPEAWYGRFTFQFPPREEIEGMHIFFSTAVKKGELL